MRIALTNFTGGEVSPSLSARYDLSRYKNSVQCMQNFLPTVHGNVERRPGTKFLADLGSGIENDAVLFPFSFNVEQDQNFVLILTHQTMRVANHEGIVANVNIEAPWDAADLIDISFAQVGDIVYMAHKKYPLHKILRTGSAPDYVWSIEEVSLNSSIAAPAKPTVTFVGEPNGYTLRYKVVAVDENGKESLASPFRGVSGKHPSDWVVGDRAVIKWAPVAGAAEYNIYREEAGYFGFIGVATGNAAVNPEDIFIMLGDVRGDLVHYSAQLTQNIGIEGSGLICGESYNTTSNLVVKADPEQNAFIADGKLFVWVTKKIVKKVWTSSGPANIECTSSTQTTYQKFWVMLTPTSLDDPTGSYSKYTTGALGNDSAVPKGTVGPYTVSSAYQGSDFSFTDNNYEADIADTPREDWNPFDGGNNPGVVSFHQQRMILAATPQSPQAFYMSRVGDFENFRKSRPIQEDDPVEYLIASGNIDSITWAASFGDLLLGTSGSEYKASGDGAPITVSNVNITAQSYWGSSNLFPIIIGNSVMHVQRHGARVRDLFYSLEKDGYSGNDLSIMAPHLFDGHSLRQWAYQQTPSSSIWIVRDDGVLLALTYMKEHDIWGWSRHVTDGKIRSVVMVSGTTGDNIFLVTQRNINGVEKFYLEKLASRWQESDGINQAFFVDSGLSISNENPSETINGLEHIEGCTVSVLADGSPIENLQVQSGSITLPYAATLVHVGLPYTSILSPLPVEGDLQTGSTLGQRRGIGQCSIRVHASVGGKYGASMDELFDFPYVPVVWGEAVAPFSGDIDFIPGGGQETNSTLWLAQDRALPFSISALVMNMDVQGG